MLEESHIKNHFITNPVWKELFLKNFPDWKPEDYIASATSLFERNGYRFVEGERLTGKKFGKLVRMELYGPPTSENADGFIFGNDWKQERDAIEQIVIPSICDYLVDFTAWK